MMRYKSISIVVGICLFTGLVLGGFLAVRTNKIETVADDTEKTTYEIPIQERSLKMVFVGDMMMDRGVKTSVAKNFDGDYSQLFAFTDYLHNADIVVGNLEGPASDIGKNVGSKYSFRMDPVVIATLANAGFSALSLANNHAGDWTIAAFRDTVNRMQQSGIVPVGIMENTTELIPQVISKNGINVALFGCTDVGPTWLAPTATGSGIVLCNNPLLVPAIESAREQYNVVIVTPHWGDEYVGFTKRQETLAKQWIDAGAHGVIGHHPHVIQATQWYNDGFIAYSLGNFIFDQHFSAETMRGMVLEMTVNYDGIVAVQPYISPLSKTYQPQPLREITDADIVTKNSRTETRLAVTCPQGTGENYFLKPLSPALSVGNHIPMNLVPIAQNLPTGGRDFCLNQSVRDAAEKMFAEARIAGHTYLITSAWRSNEQQQQLWQADQVILSQNQNQLPQAAPAGTSEHQLGTAIDIVATNALTLESFGTSQAYQWMRENAHLFGFVQSYQAGFESVNGYIAEPWHWRYVGIEHATAVYDQQIPLVTYLENLEN